jgi:hypothetical protein
MTRIRASLSGRYWSLQRQAKSAWLRLAISALRSVDVDEDWLYVLGKEGNRGM